MSAEKPSIYEFGSFRLESVKRLLLRNGVPVTLTPKAFDTLLHLGAPSRKSGCEE